MKVIINIKNIHSQYTKYNGLTFGVGEFMKDSVGVPLKDGNYNQTDFHFDEVIIVDLQEEVKRCVKFDFNLKLEKLRTYSRMKGISIDNLIKKYNES